MANYSREEAERQGKASVGAVSALLLGLGGLALKYASGASNDRKRLERRQEIDSQISQTNSQIADLSSGLLGRFLHSEQISDLENKVAALKQEREKY